VVEEAVAGDRRGEGAHGCGEVCGGFKAGCRVWIGGGRDGVNGVNIQSNIAGLGVVVKVHGRVSSYLI